MLCPVSIRWLLFLFFFREDRWFGEVNNFPEMMSYTSFVGNVNMQKYIHLSAHRIHLCIVIKDKVNNCLYNTQHAVKTALNIRLTIVRLFPYRLFCFFLQIPIKCPTSFPILPLNYSIFVYFDKHKIHSHSIVY